MSETTTTEALPPISDETRTWARTILDRYKAVEVLHSPEPRYFDPADPGQSWVNVGDALDGLGDGFEEADLQTFVVCGECGRLEWQINQDAQIEEWGYQEAVWPCRTARAMGASD